MQSNQVTGNNPINSYDMFKCISAIAIIIFCVELFFILFSNDGQLVFSLDDGYIHLALAENIIQGHYGVNTQEFSSPGSSILWPLLISPLTLLPAADWLILLFNLSFALGICWVISRILYKSFPQSSDPAIGRKQKIIAYLVLVLLIPITNLIGLVFTGMEHSLQVLIACVSILGLIEEKESSRLPKYLLPVLLIAPLVRYESLAISLPSLAYLFLRGYKTQSLITGALMLSGLIGFSLFLKSLGLAPLPTSILAKSSAVDTSNILMRFLLNFTKNITNPIGIILFILSLSFLPKILKKEHKKDQLFAAVLFSAGMMHMVAGDLWWYGRYETYVLSTLVLGFFYLYSDRIVDYIASKSLTKSTIRIGSTLGFISIPSLFILATTPWLSHEIYRQPFQFHRFVENHYQHPVALNDLGLVSYKNDLYVLDLWGLSSPDALKGRTTGTGSDWMHKLTQQYDVGLVFITESWFKEIPPEWTKIGYYNRGGTLANKENGMLGKVVFYATDIKYLDEALSAITAFSKTLPTPAKFEFEPGI